MKRQKPASALPDPTLAVYDQASAFPNKLARAKAQLAKTNLAKLTELLAQLQQTPA